jgi:hypothetical protein
MVYVNRIDEVWTGKSLLSSFRIRASFLPEMMDVSRILTSRSSLVSHAVSASIEA